MDSRIDSGDTARFNFHRQDLANTLCDSLEGKGLADARSGLFLAAPRRTGKSTFLREDLVPEVERRKWIAIYVDLWADRARDPGLLIADAIKSKLAQFDGPIAKLAKQAGMEKVDVLRTFTFNLGKIGLPPGITLADALDVLYKAVQRPVVLIIDEAQHALSTEAGTNAMFALKAARDQMNQGVVEPRLFLVFTGSNRDKLANLLLNRTQPFFGSRVTNFPLLGRPYVSAYTAWVNQHLAPNNQFKEDDMFAAFQLVGHRPEMLKGIVSEIALELGEAASLGELLKRGARGFRDRIWGEIESDYSALTEIQRAVLAVLIERGQGYSPFSEDSMKAYAAKLGHSEFSTATVQAALDALRDKNLIWKESRGAYALEDESVALWFRETRGAHAVPPRLSK
ncbi:hypothetical protein LMG19087_01875 [Ralstonia wenshanensis]|nr:hypothetical protein [Ralstonia wenshanensis]CAJ0813767.1 hypothetical protein LMG19087_01875 [Ralstonia wenshanensis]